MANCSNNFIVVSGGSPPEDISQLLLSIDVFSLSEKKWLASDSLPLMNQGRQSHTSCALNGYVYIFGGYRTMTDLSDSIERLYLGRSATIATDLSWEQIQVPTNEHPQLARMSSIFCAIDQNEILIAGGYRAEQDDDETVSDAYILDTKSLQLHQANISTP